MSDAFEPLKHLPPEGMTVSPLPASEVRQRGDRMRRRRNALQTFGAAAAVAAIAAGGVVIASPEEPVVGRTADVPSLPPERPSPASSAPPSPTATPSPSETPGTPKGGWVTEIPPNFPLTLGMPEEGGDNGRLRTAEGPDAKWAFFVNCDQVALPAPQIEDVVARQAQISPPASAYLRHLGLYRNGATAQAAVDEMVARAEVCGGDDPVEGIPAVSRWTVHPMPEAAHPYVVLEQGTFSGDTRVPGRTAQILLRVGNAVLIATIDDESAQPAIGDPEVAQVIKDTQLIAEEMCVFAADPC